MKRSDAERNREAILSAARLAFAEGSGEVSMAEISRRAGVGMATLYRNFAGRRELLEALYAAEVDVVCVAAESTHGSPGEALRVWLVQFFAFIESKKHLATELLTHVNRDNPLFSDNRARILAAGRPLFDVAQSSGDVRTDLTFEQTLDMLVCLATLEGDANYHAPILQTVLDGLAR